MQDKKIKRSNKERSDAMRKALLVAARKLFVEKGYVETGTPEIVKAAAVTRGALYHHFRDKEELFRFVVEGEALSVAKAIEKATQRPGTALQALSDGAAAYFDAMKVKGRVRLLLVDGPSILGLPIMQQIDEGAGAGSLFAGLQAARDAGEIGDIPVRETAELLSSAFDRAAIAIAGGEDSTKWHAGINALIHGLTNPLTQRQS